MYVLVGTWVCFIFVAVVAVGVVVVVVVVFGKCETGEYEMRAFIKCQHVDGQAQLSVFMHAALLPAIAQVC